MITTIHIQKYRPLEVPHSWLGGGTRVLTRVPPEAIWNQRLGHPLAEKDLGPETGVPPPFVDGDTPVEPVPSSFFGRGWQK